MRLRDGTDAVRSAGAILRTTARLVRHRRRAGPIPAPIDALTPAWLERMIAETMPGVRVTEATALDTTAGTTARTRLAVQVAGVPAPPGTLFVKLTPPDLATAVFVDLMRLGEQEVRFYRTLAPHLDVPVPRAWGAAWDPASGRFALVLDDLVASGCTLPDVTNRPGPLADADSMIATLAALHAVRWNTPPPPWLRTPTRHRRLHLERALTAFVVRHAARRHAAWLPPELRAAVPRLLAARDRLETAWASGPLTVIHGDAHAGNTFARPDGRTGLLDWQVVQQGQGMRDVSYFLCNSLPTDARRRHERDLIRTYLRELRARGAAPIPFERAWEQHRHQALYAWIAAAFTAGAGRLQSARIARAGVARASAAVVDLDSLGLL